MARQKSMAQQIEERNLEAAADAVEATAEAEQQEEGLEVLELVEEQQTRIRLPLIEGAAVVYRGSMKNMSLAYVGRVYVQATETGDKDAEGKPILYVTKECSDEGTEGYDFATHDSRGRIITIWMTPSAGEKRVVPGTKTVLTGNQLPPELRGRPFKTCEHPEHLRMFMRRRNANKEREFDILIPPRVRPVFDQYVARKESALRISEQQLQDTVK
jgi:hypothetical protein